MNEVNQLQPESLRPGRIQRAVSFIRTLGKHQSANNSNEATPGYQPVYVHDQPIPTAEEIRARNPNHVPVRQTHDKTEHLDLRTDYRYWPYGSRKITRFLAEGLELSREVAGMDLKFDGAVEGLTYVAIGELQRSIPERQDRNPREIAQEAEEWAQANGVYESSIAAFERYVQLAYDSPDVQVQHILLGVRAGYSENYVGLTGLPDPAVAA